MKERWPFYALFAGGAVWLVLIVLALFGIRAPWPLSVVWMLAAIAPGVGVAVLFYRARTGAEEG